MSEAPISFDAYVGPTYTRQCFSPNQLRTTTERVIQALDWLKAKGFKFGSVAGCGHSGSLLVGAVTLMTDLNPILVRKSDNEPQHSGQQFTGAIDSDYVFIDDLICGGNTLRRVKKVIGEGLEIARKAHFRKGTWDPERPLADIEQTKSPELVAVVSYHACSDVNQWRKPDWGESEIDKLKDPYVFQIDINDTESTWEFTYGKWCEMETYRKAKLEEARKNPPKKPDVFYVHVPSPPQTKTLVKPTQEGALTPGDVTIAYAMPSTGKSYTRNWIQNAKKALQSQQSLRSLKNPNWAKYMANYKR